MRKRRASSERVDRVDDPPRVGVFGRHERREQVAERDGLLKGQPVTLLPRNCRSIIGGDYCRALLTGMDVRAERGQGSEKIQRVYYRHCG